METIRTYLDNLFAGLPEDERLARAKSDLLSIMEDKYNALKEEGRSENEAVGAVISDFGNIDELLEELEIGRSQSTDEPVEEDGSVIRLGEEEVKDYLRSTRAYGWMAGTGVLMVLMGLGLMVFLNGFLGDYLGLYHISGTISVVVMLMFIAVGVIFFVCAGIKSDNYKQYVTQLIRLPEEVRANLEEEHIKSRSRIALFIGSGIALILMGVCAVIVFGSVFQGNSMMESLGVAVLLTLIGVGVMLMCAADGRQDGYQHLLNIEKAATAAGQKKVVKKSRAVAIFEAILWPVTIIAFLVWSFGFGGWAVSWVVFPIAGIINGCVDAAVKAGAE